MKQTLQQLFCSGIEFRWLNCQCFEIKLPNQKTILTDPCFDTSGGSEFEKKIRICNLTIDDLEGADYIIVNHTHFDHVKDLAETAKQFGSTVICHSAVAYEISQIMDIPYTSIYPVDYGGIYYLEGFTLETFHTTHHAQASHPSERGILGELEVENEEYSKLNDLGGMFNLNFLLTTDENFRIAFVGGNDDGGLKRFERMHPNLLLRNKIRSSAYKDQAAKDWADYMVAAKTPIMIPMHYETWINSDPGFIQKCVDEINQSMEKQGLLYRAFLPIPGKWYRFGVGIGSK